MYDLNPKRFRNFSVLVNVRQVSPEFLLAFGKNIENGHGSLKKRQDSLNYITEIEALRFYPPFYPPMENFGRT
jgi:hypothetical protein